MTPEVGPGSVGGLSLEKQTTAERDRGRGLAAAVGAFGLWGLLPLYWKPLEDVPLAETIAHRVGGTFVVLTVLLWVRREWGTVWERFTWRQAVLSVVSGALITVNWSLFIWGVNEHRVVDASLGYFLNPLVNLVFGIVFFRERLRPWQWFAVALAAVGVANLAVARGALPGLSLALCFTFAGYAALRKLSAWGSLPGLWVETLVFFPMAAAWVASVEWAGEGTLSAGDAGRSILLMGAGVVTALPLLLFSIAARSLPMTAVAFLQYLSPSIGFILGIVVWKEAVDPQKLATFVVIWTALAVTTVEGRWRARVAVPGPVS